ncbi:LLM class flavin-dependent oxidoreductase [Saccharibacillus brassicae]|uniref:LLM class flavin-dependent oxidoreductase n=1 Tax=Saccharibacillus brassicae TaxID=2583377 RepID=A0A4Y6V3H4_SACBS|nr:LLM class flavin-dependent oxidoreductase [Saccharibacillus brassicae]QDH23057.1 LLM class flavin-dependent oxidoreductase [Saccharibacillus brassicae]
MSQSQEPVRGAEDRKVRQIGDIPISVLDLSQILEGQTAADAFRDSLNLAQHAEKWGYHRYWVAEHHNMPGVASSATSVVIGYLAAGTSTIRLGAGGIMLPNHAPLVIAEQFGTLESMYPGRIDLGLGRAPGSDRRTSLALRRDLNSGEDFPDLLEELRSFFDASKTSYHAPIRAVPGEGLDIPIWLLGSSDFSARLAAYQGLPFAFAGHFSPDYLDRAIEAYRSTFRPSKTLDKPYVMLGVSVIAADTQERAEFLSTTMQQQVIALTRGRPGKIQPPADLSAQLDPLELSAVRKRMESSIVGDRETVERRLHQLMERTQADELIVTSGIYDHAERLHSYEILADIAIPAGQAAL